MDTSILENLPELTLRDAHRVQRRLDGIRKLKNPGKLAAAQAQIRQDIEQAQQRLERRRAAIPAISYPPLPVTARRDEIAAAIRDHQVVVVAGETGSGKTTQLPKICLELGRGVRGMIGHTQPRRLAARTVADRIAAELGTELGDTVGFQIRFTDRASEKTAVKVMTDGILLAEIQNDRMLRAYDTIIIDEAHERSLNIDFLLGYLKQLLPRRPELKLIITSATIDPQRFSQHFSDAPIVEVSGRTYPVQLRYRPIVDPDNPDADPDRDQTQAIADAVDELCAEGPGDILVFLSGEREIRDTADALEKQNLRDTEILPLFARLSVAEQHRVFASHRGRRIVLATNVAETSLTVPGIKYVIDPGTARISRYSNRTKVQRLPIEPISQASADQRKGRCGRTSDGICIRLYSEEDFQARPEYTDPEILRTNLASVILQMTALGLGDVAAFPFVDPPDHRSIKDGVSLLHELGAIDPNQPDLRKRLTGLGRKLSQLPVDPRLGRMVIEADRNGCTREVMVIAAALSIQDPRERPADKQQAADEKHRRFATEKSDFMAYLNLWNYLRKQQKALSGNQFRKLCRTEFLNYLRVREWQDINSQLRQTLRQLDISESSTPDAEDRIHTSLLAGLLSHIGMKEGDRNEYVGARNARFAIFPGSGLFKKPPRWVMVAELVETSRLWGRMAAQIEPEWAEQLAPHLIKRNYSEPHWEKKRGEVVAYEKVTLYGIPIVASRKVGYGKVDPELSRELFLRHALVEGDWDTHHKFFHANAALRSDVEELENRARRRDIVVDDETLFEFYDRRVGKEVVSARHFDAWWNEARHKQPDLLTFDPAMLVRESARTVSEADYPTAWAYDDIDLPVTYQFEPGAHADGVTVHIPLAVLGQVEPELFQWQIPGLREELFTALLRSLPKSLRRNFVPIPDHVRELAARIGPADGPLLPALERELYDRSGVQIPREAWDLARVPEHLKVTFAVEEDGRILAEGKDLPALTRQLRSDVRAELSAAATDIERHGLQDWENLGRLPEIYQRERGGLVVTAYPALVDEGDSVGVGLLESPAAAAAAHWAGTRRLLMLTAPSPMRQLVRTLGNRAKLALRQSPHGSADALLEDCLRCAVDALIRQNGGPVRDPEAFAALQEQVRRGLFATAREVLDWTLRILTEASAVRLHIPAMPAPVAADLQAQLDALVYPGFVSTTGWQQLPELIRYLQAMQRRMERVPADAARDREWMAAVHQVVLEYQHLAARLGADPRLLPIRWMIEELRVSYFAQALGTPYPISPKRIYAAMDALED